MFRVTVRDRGQVLTTDWCQSIGCACKSAFRWLQIYPGAVFDIDDSDGRRYITAGTATSTVSDLFDQVKVAMAASAMAMPGDGLALLAMAVDVLQATGAQCVCGHTHQSFAGGFVLAYCNLTSCDCMNYRPWVNHG